MSLAPTTAEVERAKSQLKASLLLGLDGTTAIAEDVGHVPFTCHLCNSSSVLDWSTDDHHR
jgi:processing peptidase subunit beta